MTSSGIPNRVAEPRRRLARDACEAGPETLVDRGEQDEHERRPRVDEPERDGPVDLLPVGELVRHPVAVVVVSSRVHTRTCTGALSSHGSNSSDDQPASAMTRTISARPSSSVTTSRRWPWL